MNSPYTSDWAKNLDKGEYVLAKRKWGHRAKLPIRLQNRHLRQQTLDSRCTPSSATNLGRLPRNHPNPSNLIHLDEDCAISNPNVIAQIFSESGIEEYRKDVKNGEGAVHRPHLYSNCVRMTMPFLLHSSDRVSLSE